MQIVDLGAGDEARIQQVAALLVEGFREHWPDAWPDLDSALEEVHESFAPDRISRVALDEQGSVLGWVGGIPQYDGLVWELHPLVVRADARGRGVGRALVSDLEERVQEPSGTTNMDFEFNQSSTASASGRGRQDGDRQQPGQLLR
jgi:aminoglycoside 6'-N-acetyltransferase I